jgi:nucleoid DNA-binding protein
MNMNRMDLVDDMAEILGGRQAAEDAFDCIIETIKGALKRGEPVSLAGFGTFKVSERGARKGRNPRTGEFIEIAAKTVPKFVPAKALKDAVDEES